MKPYTDILLLSLVVIFIVDLSGFTETWLAALSKWLGRTVRSVKPFSCSLCMTWWCGLAYAIITKTISIPIVAYIAALSYFSFTISQVLIFIHEKLLEWISRR